MHDLRKHRIEILFPLSRKWWDAGEMNTFSLGHLKSRMTPRFLDMLNPRLDGRGPIEAGTQAPGGG